MALVHEQLYQATDLARIDFVSYVDELVGYLGSIYNGVSNNVALITEVVDVALSVETAVPLGLIINELVTNSLKHAFPEEEKLMLAKVIEMLGYAREIGDRMSRHDPEDFGFANVIVDYMEKYNTQSDAKAMEMVGK